MLHESAASPGDGSQRAAGRASLDSGECGLEYSSRKSQDSVDTLGTTSSWGVRRASTSSCLHSAAAATDEGASLACDEELDQELDAATQSFLRAPAPHTTFCLPSLRCVPGVVDREVLRNELEREPECCPKRSPSFCRETRSQAVSWLVEVATELELQSCTLFLAATYLDRYLELSKVTPPPGTLLQLLALACVSIAAKQEEVKQRVSQQWLALARGEEGQPLFTKDDLVKMEWLVLETLEWRTRVPTAHTFLQLLLPSVWSCDALACDELKQRIADVAAFLTELSMLDDRLLNHSYSTVAGASLVLAEYVVLHNPPGLATKQLISGLLPIKPDDLLHCVSALHSLHLDATNGIRVMRPTTMRFGCILRAAGLLP